MRLKNVYVAISIAICSAGVQAEAFSPEQQKACKGMGRYAETVVDLYISGTSRMEALRMIDNNGGKEATRELLRKITNSSYDDLVAFGTIRTQDARTALKGNIGIKGEMICLKSLNSK